MKKLFLILVVFLTISALPMRAERMFLAQPNQTLALMQQEATEYDTVPFTVQRAACAYYPSSDTHEQGTNDTLFYTIVTLYGSATKYPQLQFHVLVHDTMCMTNPHDVFHAIRYYDEQGGVTAGIGGDYDMLFDGYREADGWAVYDIEFAFVLVDNRVLVGSFHDAIRFFNAEKSDPNHPFIPNAEPWVEPTPEAIEQHMELPAPTKVLRNGQLLITTPDGHLFTPDGRPVRL